MKMECEVSKDLSLLLRDSPPVIQRVTNQRKYLLGLKELLYLKRDQAIERVDEFCRSLHAQLKQLQNEMTCEIQKKQEEQEAEVTATYEKLSQYVRCTAAVMYEAENLIDTAQEEQLKTSGQEIADELRGLLSKSFDQEVESYDLKFVPNQKLITETLHNFHHLGYVQTIRGLSQETVELSGLEDKVIAGEVKTVTLRVSSAYNPKSKHVLNADITSPNGCKCEYSVVNLKDGSFLIKFTPSTSGLHKLQLNAYGFNMSPTHYFVALDKTEIRIMKPKRGTEKRSRLFTTAFNSMLNERSSSNEGGNMPAYREYQKCPKDYSFDDGDHPRNRRMEQNVLWPTVEDSVSERSNQQTPNNPLGDAAHHITDRSSGSNTGRKLERRPDYLKQKSEISRSPAETRSETPVRVHISAPVLGPRNANCQVSSETTDKNQGKPQGEIDENCCAEKTENQENIPVETKAVTTIDRMITTGLKSLKADFIRSIGSRGDRDECLQFPIGVTVSPNTDVIICDNGNHMVKIFDCNGKLKFTLGKTNGFHFRRPSAVVCNDEGVIFIKDDFQIYVFDHMGKFLRAFGKGTLNKPYGLVINGLGDLMVMDQPPRSPVSIVVFNQDGTFVKRVQYKPQSPCEWKESKCRFIHSHGRNDMFLVDLGTNLIYHTSFNGKERNVYGLEMGRELGSFNDPSGITGDSSGNLLIGDSKNNRIQILGKDGEFKGIVELSRRIVRPSGIHMTDDDHLLVVNYLEHCVNLYKLKL